MRFLQSELCVYLNLLKDYPIYIEYNKKMSTIPVVDDLAAATGGNRRPGRKQRKKLNSDELTALTHLNRLLDFAFVCNVLTIVDMLGHMRKFSLFAQMSNSLPLEVLEGKLNLIARFKLIRDKAYSEDKRTKKTTSMELPTDQFPIFNGDLPGYGNTAENLKAGKFMGHVLILPLKNEAEPDGERYSLEEAWQVAHEEVHDFAAAFVHFYETRAIECKGAPIQGEGAAAGFQRIDPMGLAALKIVGLSAKCIDLRAYLTPPLIQQLPDYVQSLADIHALATAGGVEFGPLQALQSQLETVAERLAAAAQCLPFSQLDSINTDGTIKDNGGWFTADGAPKSGTVIMKVLFTDTTLSAGVGDFLYFFQHLSLKTSNEAFVEGICGTVAAHASKKRAHLDADKYMMESFIDYNGPLLKDADKIIEAAFDAYFAAPDGQQRDWHFQHTPNSVWEESECAQAC